MNSDVILDALYLLFFTACVIIGNNVVESWWSFLFGAVVALAARNVGNEMFRRFERRKKRRSRLR